MLNSLSPAILGNTLTHTNWGDFLDKNSTNSSYLARGIYRVSEAVPRDRSLDYIWRDIFMVLVSGMIFELSFRLTDQFFTMPKMAELLNLNTLHERYQHHPIAQGKIVKSYDTIPGFLRENVVGSLFRSKNFEHTPDNIANYELPKLQKFMLEAEKALEHIKKDHATKGNHEKLLKAAEERYHSARANYESAQVVHYHIQKRMNYGKHLNHLVQQNIISSSEKDHIWQHLTELQKLRKSLEDGKIKAPAFKKATAEVISKAEAMFGGAALDAFHSGNSSLIVSEKIQKVVRYGKWLSMVPNIGLTLVLYGLLASYIDNNVIQPWQSKLVKKYGDVKFTQTPSFWAVVPAVGTMVAAEQLSKTSRFIRNHTGYVSRYVLSSVAGFAVYLGIQTAWIKLQSRKMDNALEVLPLVQAQPQNQSLLMPQAFKPFKPKYH